jgi:glycopeptide antibiotics resistance protein
MPGLLSWPRGSGPARIFNKRVAFSKACGRVASGTYVIIAFAVLPLPLLFLRWRGKSAGYLLCFALFFLYGWSVLTYTIFSFAPHGPFVTTFEPVPWYEDMNLVPAVVSGTFDVRSYQVYGNVLLGVPFGVGFPFLVRTSRRT